ncbi:MAG: dihydroorotase [Firmicutes bacterium]|nr:dihydroorotase [Bacillota bacterium]
MDILIKNSRVIDWSQDFKGDVYVENGIIKEIGIDLQKDCAVVDGEGMALLPSFIDLHVHFRDPGLTYKEDLESGSKAAVKGGYTMVNLMANTKPVCSDMDTVNYVLDKVREIGLVDAHQCVSITRGFDGKDISHLEKLGPEVRMISEDGYDVMDSSVMLSAMNKAREKGITVMCHSENHDLSKVDMRLAEDTMTWRNIALGEYSGCAVHIAHVSTVDSMSYIVEAKGRGSRISCEVAPHHIALTSDVVYRVNPPLRERRDADYLIKCIRDGYVDAIATDHAPHTAEDKKNGSPGMVGIETAFQVCYTKLVCEGHIDLPRLSEIMSKRPAEIIGANKGQIKIGFDGDLVLVDLEKDTVITSGSFLSKGRNTPFEGFKVKGEVARTFKGGRQVYPL